MSIFISYIFLGLTISAPLGPVNAAQIDKGIKMGFLHAWLIGLGAMLADMLYIALVFLGLVSFVHLPVVKIFLWLFGAFVLVYTGIETLLNMKGIRSDKHQDTSSRWRTLVTGFLMSVSSPLSIMFWIGIYGSVLAQTAENANNQDLLIYSLGIVVGIIIWDFAMAGIASLFRSYLTTHLLTLISIVSGLSLIGFGGYFAAQAFQALFG